MAAARSRKLEFIAGVLETIRNDYPDLTERSCLREWFTDARETDATMRLTKHGFEFLQANKIPNYPITISENWAMSSKNILRMRVISCPWYLSKKDIVLYGDKEANWLTMLAGDLDRFLQQWG